MSNEEEESICSIKEALVVRIYGHIKDTPEPENHEVHIPTSTPVICRAEYPKKAWYNHAAGVD